MPWNVVKRGSQYCVVAEDGETVPGGCHMSRAKAVKHQRALYANVDEAKELSSLIGELIEAEAAAMSRVTKEDGRYVIETISTAAVPDRENETFTIEAIDYDIQQAKETGQYPEYRVIHSPLLGIGRVKEMRRIGIFAYEKGLSYRDPFSLEVCEKLLLNNSDGKWRVSRGFSVKEVSGGCPKCGDGLVVKEKHMIAGFRCPTCRSVHLNYRGVLKDVRFRRAKTFDITITDVPAVPVTSASATRFNEIMEKQMNKEQLRERLLAAGISEEVIDERLKSISADRLKELGSDIPDAVLLKEFDEPEAERGEEDVVVGWEEMRADLMDSFKELLDGFEVEVEGFDPEAIELKELPQIAELQERIESQDEKIDSLAEKIDLLLASDEDRLKEMLENTSRNGKLRIQRFKAVDYTDDDDEEEEDEDDDGMDARKQLEKLLADVAKGQDAVILDQEGHAFKSMTDFVTRGTT